MIKIELKKILLLDRDGVINKRPPVGEYITDWNDFKFILENVKGLKRLSELEFSFIVISNQACIGKGMIRAEKIDEINKRMKTLLGKEGIKILDVYVCPHHPDDNCDCRKPKPGMFFQASKDWQFKLDKTYYIGDDPRDCQAAYNAGCKSIFVGGNTQLNHLSEKEYPLIIVKNIEEAVIRVQNEDKNFRNRQARYRG